MKTRLNHVRANVSDIHKAIEWYQNTLGFECTGADITENWSYADFSSVEGAVFAIALSDRVPSNGRFNFDVDDVDSLWISLKEKATIVEEIQTMPYGTRKFTILDIDGNELGFVQQNYIEMK